MYTYYDYLELPPGASTARVEAAYGQLLQRFGYGSTDAGQDTSGLVRMIHAAYETLSNPESRRRYDAELARDAAMADAELKATLDQQANPTVGRRAEALFGLRSIVGAVAA